MSESATGFKGYFWLLVQRDLKVRYAGSTLGALWNVIHPLMMIAIYMIIFSELMPDKGPAGDGARVDYGGLRYGVHLCAGLIPWMMFSDVLLRSVGVLLDNGNFLKKVSFPPLVLYASVFFNALLVHLAAFVAFLGILVAIGKPVPVWALGAIVVMVWLGIAGLGLGLILSGLNVFFRDTGQVVSVAMQLLFWSVPVVYTKERVFNPETAWENLKVAQKIGRVLLTVNPFERFVSAAQWLVGVGATAPTRIDWAILAVFPAICLGAGLVLFRRMLPDVRDCL